MIRDAVDMLGDRFGVTRFTIDNHSTSCPTSRRADSQLHDSWSRFRPRENVLKGGEVQPNMPSADDFEGLAGVEGARPCPRVCLVWMK